MLNDNPSNSNNNNNIDLNKNEFIIYSQEAPRIQERFMVQIKSNQYHTIN